PQGDFAQLLQEIRRCTLCGAHLPLEPRPIVRGAASAKLLIISQAPGIRAHETGLSFNDKSGERLRYWMGIGRDAFYDETRVAVMPIGFCYPGRTGSGDLPPRPECAPLWHPRIRRQLSRVELTLLVGSYAIRHYLPHTRRETLNSVLGRWREFLPQFIVLPHPSWRAAIWERNHPWFAAETVPDLRVRVARLLSSSRSAPCPRR
ncbi:MAG TPA: uracil-DNA glycosylase family protein, partial [Stellaceae bacterium]|nr:uracil-DNA glycosylase family protein [Stellaceae bacterium]